MLRESQFDLQIRTEDFEEATLSEPDESTILTMTKGIWARAQRELCLFRISA
jgi:hypothetical protein